MGQTEQAQLANMLALLKKLLAEIREINASLKDDG